MGGKCSTASQASIDVQTHTYRNHRHPLDVSYSLQTKWASSVTGAPAFQPQWRSLPKRLGASPQPLRQEKLQASTLFSPSPPYNTLPCPRPPCPHLPRPHLPSCFPALSLRVDKGFVAQTADVMSRTLPMTPEQKVRHGHGHTMQEAPLLAPLLRPVASCVTVTGNPQVITVCCVTAAPSAQLALSPRLALVASCCVAAALCATASPVVSARLKWNRNPLAAQVAASKTVPLEVKEGVKHHEGKLTCEHGGAAGGMGRAA